MIFKGIQTMIFRDIQRRFRIGGSANLLFDDISWLIREVERLRTEEEGTKDESVTVKCLIERNKQLENDIALIRGINPRYYRAVTDALTVVHIPSTNDAKKDLKRLIACEVQIALDPLVSKEAQELKLRGYKEGLEYLKETLQISKPDVETQAQIYLIWLEILPDVAKEVSQTALSLIKGLLAKIKILDSKTKS